MSLLQETWFFVLALIIIIYIVLDGFDLGASFCFFLTNNKRERKTIIKSIAPFWDGNEVWLLAAGGVIFAAFPEAYATLFSAFYLPFVLVAFGLILRAVAIELKDEFDSPLWEKLTDIGFILGSLIPTISFGVLIGSIAQGIPIDETNNFSGNLLTLINPYSLLTGLLSLTMVLSHGALYIRLRTTNELAKKATGWALLGLAGYITISALVLFMSFFINPQLSENYIDNPSLIIVPLLGFFVILTTIWLVVEEKKPIYAFMSSALAMGLNILGVAIAFFPNLVNASNDPARSLTIYNASSGESTLIVILGVALVAFPLVLAYTAWFYKTFSGKLELVDLEEPTY